MCWNLFKKKEKKSCWWDCCSSLAPHAHWLLRLALAGVFLYHGLTKFSGMEWWTPFFTSLGMPEQLAILVPIAEAGGAILILLGGFGWDWMTRLGALVLIPVMLGALITVHWGQWVISPSETHPGGGMEFATTLLAIQFYFLIVGNGVMCPGSACGTKK